jgi:hypothetical protein
MGYQSDGYYIGRDIPHLLSDNSGQYNTYSQLYGKNLANDTSSIYGQLPAVVANPSATVITSVNNVPTSYAFGLTLPYPVGNAINGIGGGWINNYGQTWPVPSASSANPVCKVISITSPTKIIVQCNGSSTSYDPIPGLTAINWIDRSGGSNKGWRAIQATVLSFSKSHVSGTAYNYTITLDTPLVCAVTQSSLTQSTSVSAASDSAALPVSTLNVSSTFNFPQSGTLEVTSLIIPSTSIAAGSDGQYLPQSVIDVGSTTNFSATGGIIFINGYAITYTATTPTSFTGCAGGSGLLHTGNAVTASSYLQQQQVTYSGITGTSFTGCSGGSGTLHTGYPVQGTALGPTDFYGNNAVATGNYIFPASINIQNYINTVMNSYASLGPGQVTSNTTLLQLGASRQPSIATIYSSILGTQFLQALTTNNGEIYSSSKLYNSTDGISNIPAIPTVTPPIPNIFIPQNIAFYDAQQSII